MSFDGFGEDAFDFYAGLIADNSKAYWSDHSETYRMAVREPMEALLADLAPEFGVGTLFRPYRDVRFAKDKSPYKTHAGAYIRHGESGGHYVQINADGLYAASGYYQLATDQLERLRRAIDNDMAGAELERLLADLTAAGFELGGEQVRTRPRGWPADHPRLELLRRKALYAGRSWEPAEWMHTPDCAGRIAATWRELTPLATWLTTHVGPTTAPLSARR
jgi:uncharacterized protein (TIGR02453 family)